MESHPNFPHLSNASSKPICHLVIGPNTCNRAINRSKCHLPPDTHIFIAQEGVLPEGFEYVMIRPETFLSSFHQGSGPVDILSIVNFVCKLDEVVFSTVRSSYQKVVCCAEHNPRSLTCCCLLVGAYTILKLGLMPSQTAYCFRGIDLSALEPFKEPSNYDFELPLADCWQAIARAKSFGWIDIPRHNTPYLWGLVDIDAYAYYSSPLNADLHEVIPGKLIALSLPLDLGGKSHVDM